MQERNRQSYEIVFEVAESAEGGYSARALGHSIYTEGVDWLDLKTMVRDAALCHFEDAEMPKIVRLRYEREETIAI